jgi:F-type H+-transporting ATPase subunit b
MLQRRWTWISATLGAVGALILPVLAWGASEGGDGGGGIINLDKSLIIQGVNFLILLYLLQRILYKPLLAKMSERTEAIKQSLAEAQRARAEAARQQEENVERLRAAHAEAASIRAAALKEAAEEQRKLVEAARAEAARLIESTRAQMEADIRRAREELRREVADLAIGAAEKLIRKSLDDADHRRIVAEAVGQLRN